jgi:hypothetical protein
MFKFETCSNSKNVWIKKIFQKKVEIFFKNLNLEISIFKKFGFENILAFRNINRKGRNMRRKKSENEGRMRGRAAESWSWQRAPRGGPRSW